MSLVIGVLFGLELVLATRPYRTLPVTTSLRTYTTTREGILDGSHRARGLRLLVAHSVVWRTRTSRMRTLSG